MIELERRALLGDRQAQEECTRQGILLGCPHCKGNAKVSFKDTRFVGQNIRGDKKLVYRVQVICNKCRSRGKPIFTEPLINPNPYITKWGNCYHAESEACAEETKRFLPYVLDAISAWNTRPAPPVGRCGECGRKTLRGNRIFCEVNGIMNEDDFCNYFKPKEGE